MSEPDFLTATRTAYDTVAVDYESLLRDELGGNALDRALLGAFAEDVLADGAGPVADLGCGPGRVTTHLASIGLDVFGLDLSPAMVAVARERLPELRFVVGSLLDLEAAGIEPGSLAGAVAWYSIIHTPPAHLPKVFAEFRRALRPGGRLLLAFQAGDHRAKHLERGYGHEIDLDAYRLDPDTIADLLGEAGFVAGTATIRQARGLEPTPQAYLQVTTPDD
ncbi:class I SAM-dependent methyltransferase [Occultella aeris]|uniref:Putative methyltransferase n=1 Tax=Occultella aeris TaxID=2761496 RepID=A0A7M4DH15_9MICO|nr:class I SAM-dependent methyltransferase [Occultella aeris]VZO36208.1 putative methyltransferase [Occultella aeris]